MADTVPITSALNQISGFRWGEVPPVPGRPTFALLAEPDLGGIAGFVGTFKGVGLNTIFRPQNVTVSPTPLPNPASGPSDNILELNLTEEVISFSPALGSVPNRGMVQGDIFLNGIPYLQTVNDVTDPANPVGIHLEPGVWLSVPATTVPPLTATVARLGSIPHGTTVAAQGVAFTVDEGPVFQVADITPFAVGDPSQRVTFPSQTAADGGTFRLPQDLTPFIAAGTITQDILDNPNVLLSRRAAAQTITSTTVIPVGTDPAAPLFGGGTDNIAFLLGDRNAAAPNADAVQMSAVFWVETVTEQITVPAGTSTEPVIVRGGTGAGAPVVSFAVTAGRPTTADVTVTASYTQLQYTQTVLLNFNGLSWPHVSVATLVPNEPVPVTI